MSRALSSFETVAGVAPAAAIALQVSLVKHFLAARGAPGFRLAVHLEISAGITILFGRSGAGKSTLLDCIAGLLTPEQGRIVLAGAANQLTLFQHETGVNLPLARRCVGYVFQNLALFPHLTIEQNVEYGLAQLTRSERRARSHEILRSFHVEQFSKRRPHELSGGERQRVALARTLVIEPRALLLDEPLSALDSATKIKILEDLRAWNAVRNIPVLYVTHNRGEALRLAERVIVLQEGEAVTQGDPQAILQAADGWDD
ncbi:MAG: ATP-binding cassette domain-containing protein [Candidatus Acidiferrum sp.]